MVKKIILPSLRIESKTERQMAQAIEKINEKSIVRISQNDFIRISLEFFSQWVLSGKDLDMK